MLSLFRRVEIETALDGLLKAAERRDVYRIATLTVSSSIGAKCPNRRRLKPAKTKMDYDVTINISSLWDFQTQKR